MLLVLDIAGVVLLLQGIAPIVQRMSGQDPSQSFFIVNKFPHQQNLASVVLILLGVLLLSMAYKIRKLRK